MKSNATPQIQQQLREDPAFFAEHYFGLRPHAAQKQILNELKNPETKVAVAACGRQFGKSLMLAVYLIWRAMTKPGQTLFIVSYSQDQANIIFDYAMNFLLNSKLNGAVNSVKRNPFPVVYFVNGSQIHARSASHEGNYLRGKHCHGVVIDEAQLVTANVVQSVIRQMLLRHAGNLFMIGTPFGHNFFYEQYQLGEKGTRGYKSFHFTSYDNPTLPRSELEFDKAITDDLTWRCEYMAEFIDDQNMVFKWDVLVKAMDDYSYSSEPEAKKVYVMGVDVARKIDFTTIAVVDVTNPRKAKLVYNEKFNELNVGGLPFWDYVVERIVNVGKLFSPYRIVIDSSSAGNPISAAIQERGLTQVEEYTFANTQQNPKKVILISNLKLAFEQARLKIPADDKSLIDELKFFGYKLTEHGNIQMEGTMGRHDDQVIALALAWSANMGAGELFVAGVDTGSEAEKENRVSGTLAVDSKKDFYGQNYEYGFGNSVDFVSVV